MRAPDHQLVEIDASALLDQVLSRIRQETLVPELSAVRFYSGLARSWTSPVSPAPGSSGELTEAAHRIENLQESLQGRVAAAIENIGQSPTVVSTIRGIVGSVAIGGFRRLLWWYTRSLMAFGDSIGDHFQAELEAIKSLALAEAATRLEIAELRREVNELRAARGAVKPGDPH